MKILSAFLQSDNRSIISELNEENKHTITFVNASHEFFTELSQSDYDVIITDLLNKQSIKEIIIPTIMSLSIEKRPYVYIICEPAHRKKAIECLGTLQGDYILTPLESFELNKKIEKAQYFNQSLEALQRDVLPTLTNSIYNPYLGILNQNTIFEYLINEINTIKRTRGKMSLIILEFNELDYIKKHYGKKEMYNVLRYISQILKVNIRLSDKIGTWVNNKFMIILSDCEDIHINLILERISKSSFSLPITFEDNKTINLTISAGTAHITHEDETAAFLIVNQANENFRSYAELAN